MAASHAAGTFQNDRLLMIDIIIHKAAHGAHPVVTILPPDRTGILFTVVRHDSTGKVVQLI